jgi:hypothetical protein
MLKVHSEPDLKPELIKLRIARNDRDKHYMYFFASGVGDFGVCRP